MSAKLEVVRRLFRAVEERDLETLLDCYADDVQIEEAESLPYGGTYRGREGAQRHAMAFVEAWGRFQGPSEYDLEATFYEGEGETVAVVFRHKAVDAERGERLNTPEVSIYEVDDGKVVRSRMFHADPAALTRFLEAAEPG